jgi:hypothetical protein
MFTEAGSFGEERIRFLRVNADGCRYERYEENTPGLHEIPLRMNNDMTVGSEKRGTKIQVVYLMYSCSV